MRFLILVFSLMFSAFAFCEMNLEGRWKTIDRSKRHHCVLPEHLEEAQKEGVYIIKRRGSLKLRPDGSSYGSDGGWVTLIEAPSLEGASECSLIGEGTFRGQCAVCNAKIRSPKLKASTPCIDVNDHRQTSLTDNVYLRFYSKDNFIYVLANYNLPGVCRADSNGLTGWILKKRK